MTVTVPASDAVNFALQADITTIGTVITNNANNFPWVFKLTKEKANKQLQLVLGLLGSGSITAASVLTNCTYTAAQPGADQQ